MFLGPATICVVAQDPSIPLSTTSSARILVSRGSSSFDSCLHLTHVHVGRRPACLGRTPFAHNTTGYKQFRLPAATQRRRFCLLRQQLRHQDQARVRLSRAVVPGLPRHGPRHQGERSKCSSERGEQSPPKAARGITSFKHWGVFERGRVATPALDAFSC